MLNPIASFLIFSSALILVNSAEATTPAVNRPDAGLRQAATADEYLTFLYRYMSLPDSLDRTREFYRQNVEASLQARSEMPWGSQVPEREFRHFVLPVRVNNEALDTSRVAFYHELRDRVKGLTMSQAALEVNHWCHEKVTYRPSDGRTLSPLDCVRTGWGRCGEESTFTVAAMRAVGIPARQVYTPRWAHTDDNHAWVEVWTDGRWHFLGACEPESILDLAWFNVPASRGMVMATNVHGLYDGPEEVLEQRQLNTRINVTSVYAPVTTTIATVVDTTGSPVEGTSLRFGLYNYGEFYPLTVRATDTKGQAQLTSGQGDMLLWAADAKGNFGFQKATAGEHPTVILDKNTYTEGVWDFDLVPPKEGVNLPKPTAEQVAVNNLRLAYEDSLRQAYLATFYTPEKSRELAEELGFNPTTLERLLPLAHGNRGTIITFLKEASDRSRAIAILEAIASKDLCDISAEVLWDAYNSAPNTNLNEEIYNKYVLNPRIAFEQLTPWHLPLHHALDSLGCSSFTAQQWRQWLDEHLTVDSLYIRNPGHALISPLQTLAHRRDIDPDSRDLLLIAGCRAIGIPARINPMDGKAEYYDNEEWQPFYATKAASPASKGQLQLTFDDSTAAFTPRYYSHFTLERLVNGVPHTLEFPENETFSQTFGKPLTLDAGQYMLVSGQRLANGSVLARIHIFEVLPDTLITVPVSIRHDDSAIAVVGNFNSESPFVDALTGNPTTILSANGRGYFVVALLQPNHEPSIHLLNELQDAASQLEQFSGKIFLIYTDRDQLQRANLDQFPHLPSNVVLGYELPDRPLSSSVEEGCEAYNPDFSPTIFIADTFNRVVYLNQGYQIGQGDRLAKLLHTLQAQ